MKLEFKINKYYLAGHTFGSKIKSFKEWINLENRIWQKYKNEPAYYFINPKYIDWALEQMQISFLYSNIELVFKKESKKLQKIYKKIFRSKEFKKLHKETEKYLNFVKNQWKRNEKEIYKIMEKITGLKLPNENITVFITHPKLKNGRNFPDLNAISWGHKEDWKNYSTVYIAHELMHILTFKKTKNFDVMHALIELMTDNELRIRLNKKGKYFKENKFDVGHQFLRKLEKRILPYWKLYLKSKDKNIFVFEKEIIKRLARSKN